MRMMPTSSVLSLFSIVLFTSACSGDTPDVGDDAGASADMRVTEDMTVTADLGVAEDMTVTADLGVAEDMTVVADLAVEIDMEVDMAVACDFGSVLVAGSCAPRWVQNAYVKASNPGEQDWFGVSAVLSADGSRLAVGAPNESSNAMGVGGNENNNGAEQSGAVYIFARSGGVWAQEAYVKASNTQAGDMFGHSISLSADGSRLAVGALGESSNATGIGGNQTNNGATGSGAVYVFSRTGTTWTQEAYVKASNTGGNDQFGYSVALSADGALLAVGALFEDSDAIGVGGVQGDNDASESGAVYVFARSGAVWSQEAYVKASNTGAGDRFGASVALSVDGSTMAVGAWTESGEATGVGGDETSNSASQAGAVYVFTRTGSTWAQQAYVKASNTGAGDWFGLRVALSSSGDRLAVGARMEDSNATGIGGDSLNNASANSGAVYVFARIGTTWAQEAYIKASNTGSNDQFGESVSLSDDGTRLAVGAFGEDSIGAGVATAGTDDRTPDSGAAYVFVRSGSTWRQEAYVKASNTGETDQFGVRVSLSGDGTLLAVGAYNEDSSSFGVGGDQTSNDTDDAGAVYVFNAREPT